MRYGTWDSKVDITCLGHLGKAILEFMNFQLFGQTTLVVNLKFELFWAIHSASELEIQRSPIQATVPKLVIGGSVLPQRFNRGEPGCSSSEVITVRYRRISKRVLAFVCLDFCNHLQRRRSAGRGRLKCFVSLEVFHNHPAATNVLAQALSTNKSATIPIGASQRSWDVQLTSLAIRL